jgi:putative glycosyltransferase
LAGSDFPKNITTARLMTKAYVASLVRHQERELMLGGLFHIVGYNQVPFVVTKKKLSETTYSFSHRLSLLTNAIVSFSSKPLVYIFYLGLVTALISFLFIIQIFLGRLLFGQTLLGWASLIASVWFLGGLIILCLGVIGIYISKIFTETKNRPYTIIKKIYKR